MQQKDFYCRNRYVSRKMQQKSTLNISLDKYYSVYNGQKTTAMMKSIRV